MLERTKPTLLLACLFSCMLPLITKAQAVDSSARQALAAVNKLPVKSVDALNGQYQKLETRLSKSTGKTLRKMQQLEDKLRQKMAKTDSLAAQQLFANAGKKYETLLGKLKQPPTPAVPGVMKEYLPRIDSLQSTFRFLEKIPGVDGKKLPQMASLTGTLTDLQSRINLAADVKQFMKERKQQLKEQFERLGMGKELKRLNKEVYYYQQQLNEYKEMLQSPDKLAAKALSLVRDMPAFKDFMSRNSQLAQLFRLPGSGSAPASLAGLQTRDAVQQQLSSQFGTGVNPQQYMQQQLQQAEGELNKLKDKVNKLGGGSSEMEMPDFKPNSQKTKSFWKRLEYGMNIQSQKPNGWLPVTTDIALTVGYKLNDKSVLGLGASYKLGWGKDISHIKISNQGLGLRSYADVKLKGSFWISGGYEYNYQHEFSRLEQLKDLDAWQKSGLIGLSKKYKIGKKKGNLQLLWDFLSYSQVPRTQPLKFRVGYVL